MTKKNKQNIKSVSKKKKNILLRLILFTVFVAIVIFATRFYIQIYENGGGFKGIIKTTLGLNKKENLGTIYTLILGTNEENTDTIMVAGYNPKTNENHFICTLTSLPLLKNNPRLLISPFGPSALENFIIALPNARYGSMSSGSCLELPILVILNENISIEEGITIEFKVPQYAWLPWQRSPKSTSNRKKFKYYKVHYDLTDFHKTLNNQTTTDNTRENAETTTEINGK